MSSPSSSGSASRSPPTEASADELRRLNSLLRGRLARANADLQTAISSRSVTADDQHRLSRTLLRQTHDLRALESLYSAQQREVGRLRAEIASLHEPSDPGAAPDPVVVQLESHVRQYEAEFRTPIASVATFQISLAAAKKTQGVPAKELADAKRRLRDLEHSVQVLQRERDVARDARDQALRERDSFQRDLDIAHQKIAAVAAAVGPISTADASTSGPAAVLHSLRSTPVGPSAQGPPADPQDRAPSGPDAATSPSSSKRPRSPLASPGSSPAPPAKRRVAPLSPGDDDRGSKSSAGGSGSSPVDLTQDDGHLADDDRGDLTLATQIRTLALDLTVLSDLVARRARTSSRVATRKRTKTPLK
ncbi:hypothetical protein PR002_g31169 [Phytophthora rubi]|uniref:Uncharacterized protein n=1 Tax=Phytophthora rubi TaxID=129364 RepID=A0A6A3GIX4_9STRA|nr:hypothetical protein PR002_g31169 [Phytophthora rubi]